MSDFEAVIGLEVHAQLLTRSKLFCGCATTFGSAPNSNICPVCTGQPGALPALNRRAIELAIRAGIATHCTIAERSVFARKNYFYPDLPKGYQISQYEYPLCEHGYVDCAMEDGVKRVSITRIHVEEDAGKSIHDIGASEVSHVDLNRACVPLIEIVSGPDIRSPKEASTYLKMLRTILMYLEACDGNMQEGSLRCDANVSVRPRGSETFGTRAELKNLNSFRFVERAIQYEIDRQIALIQDGGAVIQETRLWDDKVGKSFSMRGKEEAHDYRYFPDPDLPPLFVESRWVDAVRQALPELPEQKVARYIQEYGLSEYDARVLTAEKAMAVFFETAVAAHSSPKKIANWITTELQGKLNATGETIEQVKCSAAHVAKLIQLIESGAISGKIAKTVFEDMLTSGKDPEQIVAAQGLTQVSDTGAIEGIIDLVLSKNPGQVSDYQSGKTNLFGFFVGQVMKESKGKANPQLVNELLRKKLGG